jgi:hypothetical protein
MWLFFRYLKILLEDMKGFDKALAYIATLGFFEVIVIVTTFLSLIRQRKISRNMEKR